MDLSSGGPPGPGRMRDSLTQSSRLFTYAAFAAELGAYRRFHAPPAQVPRLGTSVKWSCLAHRTGSDHCEDSRPRARASLSRITGSQGEVLTPNGFCISLMSFLKRQSLRPSSSAVNTGGDTLLLRRLKRFCHRIKLFCKRHISTLLGLRDVPNVKWDLSGDSSRA
jgi:hypothetical protein